MIVETQAIVLHTRKFGETSKIATLFTLDFGKVSVIAKGAAKPKSKFGSSLDPLSYINATFYMKNSPGLFLLSSSELVMPLRKIHKDPDKIAIGLMILETVSKTMNENSSDSEKENKELFNLLTDSLIKLNDDLYNKFLIFISFQLHLFKILGFEINFNNSLSNENMLKFSLNNACIVNGNIGSGRIYKISKNNWKIMESLYVNDLHVTKTNFDDDFSFSKIYDFFMVFLSFHLEKPFNLKSKSILML